MHTVELFQLASEAAERMGYQVRQEWLGGTGSGTCEVAGRKCIFLDLAENSVEQLDQLVQALRQDPGIFLVDLPADLRQLLGVRRAS